jgi:hypothetical protein
VTDSPDETFVSRNVLSGSIKNTAGNDDFCVLRLYSDGVYNWMKTFGGVGDDISTSVALKNDGGFIIGGYSSSYGAGSNEAYIVSIKSDGTGCLTNSVIAPNGGDPATDTGTPITGYNDVITYQTNPAPFNSANFNVLQNTQCIINP